LSFLAVIFFAFQEEKVMNVVFNVFFIYLYIYFIYLQII